MKKARLDIWGLVILVAFGFFIYWAYTSTGSLVGGFDYVSYSLTESPTSYSVGIASVLQGEGDHNDNFKSQVVSFSVPNLANSEPSGYPIVQDYTQISSESAYTDEVLFSYQLKRQINNQFVYTEGQSTGNATCKLENIGFNIYDRSSGHSVMTPKKYVRLNCNAQMFIDVPQCASTSCTLISKSIVVSSLISKVGIPQPQAPSSISLSFLEQLNPQPQAPSSISLSFLEQLKLIIKNLVDLFKGLFK